MGRLKETKRWKRWLPLVAMLTVFTVGLARNNWSMAQDATTAAPAAAEAAPATPPPPVPDSTGANAGGVANITAATPGAPTVLEVADRVGKNVISINIVWTLITGFLVMFMQAGFALVETGLCRAKNASHTMAMNFMIYPLGMLGFYVCGFAFMFGGCRRAGPRQRHGPGTSVLEQYVFASRWLAKPFSLIGYKGFLPWPQRLRHRRLCVVLVPDGVHGHHGHDSDGRDGRALEVLARSCSTVCAIGTIMYPIFGNWVWGGGWLAQLGNNLGFGHGAVDFAGSSVVHMQGGVIALDRRLDASARASANTTRTARSTRSRHTTFRWSCSARSSWRSVGSGLIPARRLAGTDVRIAIVAINTMLASATAAFATYLWMVGPRRMKPDPSMMCNGMLAGLVAITAPCAFVTSLSACFIGIVAGILVVESVFFIDRVLKVDDCVGAISVHGVNGAWGILVPRLACGRHLRLWLERHAYIQACQWCAGNIADVTTAPKDAVEQGVTGLFYGNPNQFWAECVGGIACFVYLAIISCDRLQGDCVR